MCAVALRRSGRAASVASLPDAPRAPFPAYIEPCDPTLATHPPRGDDWLYEIKADGYRAQVHLRHGDVTVYSRRGLNWTSQFRRIADSAKLLNAKEAVVDGEAVVIGSAGLPDFQALRRELGKHASGALLYHAFDLLYLDGSDLRALPYVERKRLLEQLLKGAPQNLVYVEYLEADGARVFEHACKMGLEGVVAKRRDSVYRSGRTESWIKLKCKKSDNFPIVAFVEKLGAKPRKIASLYIGRREGASLLYAGKARAGYTEEVARDVRERLDPFILDRSPLTEPVKKPKATWVQPVVQAEIEYGGTTDDGLLREAVFKGLRDDLQEPAHARAPAPYVSRRAKQGEHGVPRENILQLLPDAVAPSKDEIASYWKKIAKRALEYLGGRPLKLVRHTHGITFYHKGPLPPVPSSVHQLRIEKREGGEGVRVWVDDLKGLLGLVQMDAVELHPWAASVDNIERPDRLVLDLDPGPGVAREFVTETALKLRAMLEDEGYESWPKLTGGKGLHLMVPIEPRITHDQAREYCRKLAQRLAASAPDKYTISPDPKQRTKRIYIDYLRNGRGNTAIGAYSPRARHGFPIAAPVTWNQVEGGIAPDTYSIKRLRGRYKAKHE
jgi:bifunctional non-homologous end joining protein LigD